MPDPGSCKQSKQSFNTEHTEKKRFNTEHTEKKLKPQSDAEKKHWQCTMDPQGKPAFDEFSLYC